MKKIIFILCLLIGLTSCYLITSKDRLGSQVSVVEANKKKEAEQRKIHSSKLRSTIHQNFSRRCFKCHGATNKSGKKTVKGELDLVEVLAGNSADSLEVLQDSFKQILANKMPPVDAKNLGTLRQGTLEALSTYVQLNSTDEKLSKEKVYRLTINELTHKAESLLNTNLSFTNPFENIPNSLKLNRQESDRLSDSFFLSEYIKAVDEIVENAFYLSENKVEKINWDFQQPLFYTQKEYGGHKRRNGIAENIIWYGGQNSENNGIVAVQELDKKGVPYSGYFDVEITATAQNRGKLSDDITLVDSSLPLRLGLLTGLSKAGGKIKPIWYHETNETYLAEFDMPDNGFETFKVRVWLEKFYYPRLIYTNGALVSGSVVKNVQKHLKEDPEKKIPYYANSMFISESDAQRILIKSMKIKSAPFEEDKYRELFGDTYQKPSTFNRNILSFAEKAYERLLTQDEKDLLINKVSAFSTAKKLSLKQSYKYALKAILTSPKLLFKKLPDNQDSLASHISYALTGHAPDNNTFKKEEIGKVIEGIFDGDDSMYFSENFLDFWLHIYKSRSIYPNVRNKYYREYYIERIKDFSIKETYLNFLYMIKGNKSALDLLKSDYRVISAPLKKHYKLKDSKETELENVSVELAQLLPGSTPSTKYFLHQEKDAGGFISQASILNLTSDEVATNPILRGVWMIKEFLGIPLKEAPADVPSFEPDLRAATSVREQLKAHQTIKVCASCHVDMDPMGLALELYDNIGQYRETYTKGKRVDHEVTLFGEEIKTIAEYKTVLRETKSEIFVMTLSSKMLEYFLRREITDKEYFELYDDISQLKQHEYPLQSIIKTVSKHKALSNFVKK
jgi:hypothetical protein